MVHRKGDILDVEVALHRSTDRAVFVSLDGDVSKAVWLPKSQIEIEVKRKDGMLVLCEAQIPQWLAEQEGLA